MLERLLSPRPDVFTAAGSATVLMHTLRPRNVTRVCLMIRRANRPPGRSIDSRDRRERERDRGRAALFSTWGEGDPSFKLIELVSRAPSRDPPKCSSAETENKRAIRYDILR